MQTIADFKRRMTVGSKWKTLHRFKDKDSGKDLGIRECTIVQSNSFALATNTDNGLRNSWCDWPKKAQFVPVDENTVKIDFGYGTLIYQEAF